MEATSTPATPNDQTLLQAFAKEQTQLLRQAQRRMTSSLRGRVDPADVVQDALAEALRRRRAAESKSASGWLSFLVDQRVAELHRHHQSAQCRAQDLELTGLGQGAESLRHAALCDAVKAAEPSVTALVMRNEERRMLAAALMELSQQDRQIVVLRGVRGLSAAECAQSLGITAETERKRYFRARARLQGLLAPVVG